MTFAELLGVAMPRMEAAVASAIFLPFRAGFFLTFAGADFLVAVFFTGFLTVFFAFFFFAATGDSVSFGVIFSYFTAKGLGNVAKVIWIATKK